LVAQEIVAGAMSASIRKEDMATIDYLELNRGVGEGAERS
jgi:hypothetical protein